MDDDLLEDRAPLGGRALDGVVAALGLHLWAAVAFVPGLAVDAFAGAGWIYAAGPLALLVFAVARRSLAFLLLGFPVSLLFAVGHAPASIAAGLGRPLPAILAALGLPLYLVAASRLAAGGEDPLAEHLRPLPDTTQPARWRRRARVRAVLAAYAGLFPVVLVGAVLFDRGTARYSDRLFPERGPELRAVLAAAVVLLWLAVLRWTVLGTLRAHRSGDRALKAELQALRAHARRGAPRASFYVAVAAALASMFLLLLLRYR